MGKAYTAGVIVPGAAVAREVIQERIRQDAKWGEQNHPDGTDELGDDRRAADNRLWCQAQFDAGHGTWRDILTEEVSEAFAESDPAKLREELIQVAAVAVAWVEALDRRAAEDVA